MPSARELLKEGKRLRWERRFDEGGRRPPGSRAACRDRRDGGGGAGYPARPNRAWDE